MASTIINDEVKDLTDEKRSNVFIRYKKGFRLLTLGWSDGNTFLPVNSCLMASSKESNIIGPQKNFDKRYAVGIGTTKR